MEQQITELTKAVLAQSDSLNALQAQGEAIQASMEEIKLAVLELQKWKLEMEQSVDGLRSEVGELRSPVIQIARNPVLTLQPGDLPPFLPSPNVKHESMPVVEPTPFRKEGSACFIGDSGLRANRPPWGFLFLGEGNQRKFFSYAAFGQWYARML